MTCQQAYDEKAKTPRNRVWMRKRVCELLDAIAPGWTVVCTPNADLTGKQKPEKEVENV